MWPCSPPWLDPLHPSAPGKTSISRAGLRVRSVGEVGSPIVFLHGLGASLRYWGRAYDGLAANHRLLFVDLLGFGGSAKPDGLYDFEQHCAALRDTLVERDVSGAVLVAHSAGALIGMWLSRRDPGLVASVIAFGAPLYPSEGVARRHLRSLGPLARLMADESPLAARLCGFMCDHRNVARRIAPVFAPRLPAQVASDAVDHIWDSYHGTFELLIRQDHMSRLVADVGTKLTLAYGSDDRTCPITIAAQVAGGSVRIRTAPSGDHHLPLRRSGWCSDLIAEVVASR